MFEPAPATQTAPPPSAPSIKERPASQIWHALLIGLAPLLLIVGCWDAPFTSFDDGEHLRQDAAGNIIGTESLKWFVVTLQSYRLDQFLFESWMPQWLGSWAPGVRLMSCVYHALAGLVLWRIFLRLRLSPHAALAGALLFAVHPMACESVCWVSERKNTLAALFGFLSVWSLLSGPRGWRWVLSFVCFSLALMGKPTAVGFLPVLGVVTLFLMTPDVAAAGSAYRRPRLNEIAVALAPLAFFILPAFKIAFETVDRHKEWILKPPGGSVFTALLTDLEIVSRYFGNALAPVKLSAIYYVAPVESVADTRVFVYGALLAAVVGVTIWLSDRRWLSALGWLWCLGALGAHLNIIAISFWMQDRYFYLACPGFWLAIILAVLGLARRLNLPRPAFRIAVASYVALLAAGGLMRGTVWQSSLAIFSDAAEKQPRAAFAHYGLGSAWGEEWQRRQADARFMPQQVEEARVLWKEAWTRAVDCADVGRFLAHQEMALHAGELANERNQLDAAERYWLTAAYPPPGWPVRADVKAKALCWLSMLRIFQGRPEEGLTLANEAIAAADVKLTREKRASAARALADAISAQDPQGAQRLREQAQADESAARSHAL